VAATCAGVQGGFCLKQECVVVDTINEDLEGEKMGDIGGQRVIFNRLMRGEYQGIMV